MEGKGLLFKRFADIDVFDIEVTEKDPAKFVEVVKSIAVTFGGINLEDIKAPECFEIEERLKAELDIPVMHDDQHGTAIITGAGLINAAHIAGKKIEDMHLVVNGAGAAGCSCAKIFLRLGIQPQNMVMLDGKGVINRKRKDLNKHKAQFITDRDIDTLEQAIEGADMFMGLSAAGVLKPEYVKKMNANPIIFALANPVPEIMPEEAFAVRDDIIMATGRSDYPNQVNNVLGFPYIFRGALDARSTAINEDMKLAACHALADLARQPIPASVSEIYGNQELVFGRNYFIPSPFDPRLKKHVASAVAKAAYDSGVSKLKTFDVEEYKKSL
jgi:malate dehydrogenase (oxaloacetate-decarboxylating)(NADP+)